MALTHNLTLKWTSGGNEIEHTIAKSSGAEANMEEVIPLNSTDLLVAYVLNVAKIKAIFVVATVAMTIETNNGTTPTDTLTLVANEPFEWHDGSALPNPFPRGNITALYLTNTTSGTLVLRVGSSGTSSGTAVSGTITPAVGFHCFPAYCPSGLHATIASTLNVTFFFAAG